MTRPLTLAAYRDLLADVAGRHGGCTMGAHVGVATWCAADRNPVARLALNLSAAPGTAFPFTLRCCRHVNLPDDPDAALLTLDAARDTLLRAIAARDELAGVVVDVGRSTT